MMARRCGDCKFFSEEDEECRRYAPRPEFRLLINHNSELLRDLAWSLRTLAGIERPSKHDDLMVSADEVSEEQWPSVVADEWCGEFEERADDAVSS